MKDKDRVERGTNAVDCTKNHAKYQELWPIMRKDLLWTESKDVWYVHLDPLWADFQGTPATASRPIPFVDALPATLWLYKQEENQPKHAAAASLRQPPPLPKRSKTPAGFPKKIGKSKLYILIFHQT